MIPRTLEPEVMDTPAEALAYDAMDHRTVNGAFATDALALCPTPHRVLDVGTGTGLIAIVLATRAPRATVTALDLSGEMLRVAARNVARACLGGRIALVQVDGKGLPYRAGDFDLIVSNSVVHHLPEPVELFREMARVAGERASVFVRDLARPESDAAVESLVRQYASGEPEESRRLFADSLRAALTVDEARDAAERAGLRGVTVRMTSDRHWTLARG